MVALVVCLVTLIVLTAFDFEFELIYEVNNEVQLIREDDRLNSQ